MTNTITIDLSDWTRLREVDAYAKARNVDRGEAIRLLVNHALSTPDPQPGDFDWLVFLGAEALKAKYPTLCEDFTDTWVLKAARAVLEAPYDVGDE